MTREWKSSGEGRRSDVEPPSRINDPLFCGKGVCSFLSTSTWRPPLPCYRVALRPPPLLLVVKRPTSCWYFLSLFEKRRIKVERVSFDASIHHFSFFNRRDGKVGTIGTATNLLFFRGESKNETGKKRSRKQTTIWRAKRKRLKMIRRNDRKQRKNGFDAVYFERNPDELD